MASEYKKRKLKSKYVWKTELKRRRGRVKGCAFYTPSQRQELKEELKKLAGEEECFTEME